jgi:N-methylhydantoinase A
MRYVRQNFELEVPLEGDLETSDALARAVSSFHKLHDRSYGQSNESAPVEVVNVKARGSGALPKPELRVLLRGSDDSSHALTGTRRVFFKETGWTDCPDYDRDALLAGNVIAGPAIVHEFDSSVVVLPGHRATVDEYGDIVIDI